MPFVTLIDIISTYILVQANKGKMIVNQYLLFSLFMYDYGFWYNYVKYFFRQSEQNVVGVLVSDNRGLCIFCESRIHYLF